MSPLPVLIPLCLLCLLLPISATPVFQTSRTPLLDKAPDAPIDDDYTLWRTTITHATASVRSARGGGITVISAPRDGQASNVYRAVFSGHSRCVPGDERVCRVAAHPFSIVGEVLYEFNDLQRNYKGSSRQALLSCRCLTAGCDLGILARPVDIMTRAADGTTAFSGKKTCLYEAVNGKFSDCASEFMRLTYQDRETLNKSHRSDPDAFLYKVEDDINGDFWEARGRRGAHLNCLDTEIAELPTVDVKSLKPDDIGVFIKRSETQGFCAASGNVRLFKSADDEDGEMCASLHAQTLQDAARAASQQDCYAVGKFEGTYINRPGVSLVSNTELALSCSAAALGIIFLISFYIKEMRRKTLTYWRLGLIVLFQALAYGLEALPLHIALWNEVTARDWRSTFAFVDATKGAEESSNVAVLIITGILGEVQHSQTRVGIVAILTAAFDSVAFLLAGMTILTKGRGIYRDKLIAKRSREKVADNLP